jgi:hypothetical protein
MVPVVIHYRRGGEVLGESMSRDHPARGARLSRVPVAGEFITGYPHGLERVVDVVFSRDGTAHLVVEPAEGADHLAGFIGV